MDEQYADECRRALAAEQARSLSQTNDWEHVDRDRVHRDWDTLYREIAARLDDSLPTDPHIQELVGRHFEIASRFYTPSREAYVGMALLYAEDAPMREFHNSYHPRMVGFLGEAMEAYAERGAGFAA
ncbi:MULTISPECIES: TipAS antibiotic-recognition domain-containing protein [Streptomyces]|uniref:TipAS antibiotic-recognition domain-containing protein n=1 Tax=Streptomyces sudanensis TaxID=436397 RepID=A0ABY4TLB0_9ACTN|nr:MULTISPECIES: TipAS antibiotic-recognition domain-containing protein [Streptomyces]MCP9956588.1 TipAS antibiotic-recognition domain-containing protein [Streptomyces sudanensis]MCP9985789.1 TipAS antibiotic-recognition domain-containing protein [Streptomyces sudanensis]MCQ0002808.1 TipAS antibiotic-recognition domain-containing protein [Streptomyces sudanensis]URN17567.1 TipAS antibiotic-recognition domain-containing protein [Streptomyces sudanensis]